MEKKILYVAICRGEVVLCDYRPAGNGIAAFTQDILGKLKTGKRYMTFEKCHYMSDKEDSGQQMTYLIVVENGFSKQVGFEMLDLMKVRFLNLVDQRLVETARALTINPSFQPELKILHVDRFNAGAALREQP